MPRPPDPEPLFSRTISEAVRNAAPGATLIADDLVRAGEQASGPLLPQRSRQLVIGILRDAEQAGHGQVVVGRRGRPTRFIREATPQRMQQAEPQAGFLREGDEKCLEVPFSLASGRLCVLRLPANLTAEDQSELRSRIVGYLGAGS